MFDNYLAKRLVLDHENFQLKDVFIILNKLKTTNYEWIDIIFNKWNEKTFVEKKLVEDVNLKFEYPSLLKIDNLSSLIFIIIHQAKVVGRLDIVEHIRSNFFDNEDKRYIAFYSIIRLKNEDCFDDVLKIIKDNKLNLNIYTFHGSFYKSILSCINDAEKIIDAGFDVNCRDKFGSTCLFETVVSERIKLFIDKGAKLYVDGYKTYNMFANLKIEVLELLSTLENFDDFVNINKESLLKELMNDDEKEFIRKYIV